METITNCACLSPKEINLVNSEQAEKRLNQWIENPGEMSDNEIKRYFSDLGIDNDSALLLLSAFKSEKKYGYTLNQSHVAHIIELAKKNRLTNPLHGLIQNPFLLVKAAWIYDHAPSFLLHSQEIEDNRLDDIILEFADNYYKRYLHNETAPILNNGDKTKGVYQLLSTSFWERNVWDPKESILAITKQNLIGIELTFDFHPFNLSKLLPEEVDLKRRSGLKQAAKKHGLILSIHSPIVGPYAPYPEPSKGKQLFFDPARCMMLMKETIQLAIEIGAEAVVIHLIDPEDISHLVELISSAAGSEVVVSVENYCYTKTNLNSKVFLESLTKILNALPAETAGRNFGVTYDVGHMNIEGVDPLVAAVEIGKWCKENHVNFRMHATDNYGQLHFTPPHFSADIHASVSGKGINNAVIIKLLRSLGLEFQVAAEQIEPLSKKDIQTIDQAKRFNLKQPHETILKAGRRCIDSLSIDYLIKKEAIAREEAFQFIAGLEGGEALQEYLLFRKIQEKKYLTADEAKKSTLQMMSMPQKGRMNIVDYLDELLTPIQRDMAEIRNQDVDIICQNIAGGLFGALNNRQLSRVFSRKKTFKKGGVICRQDMPGREIYFIKKGKVEVFLDDSCVAILNQGEIVGEISLFYDIPRTATVKAAEDKTVIGILDRKQFKTIIRNFDENTKALIYRLYLFLPARLRSLNEKYKVVISNLVQMIESKKIKQDLMDETAHQDEGKNILLSNLSSRELDELFIEELHCPQGKVLFCEGDPADGAYLIKNGKMGILNHEGGREILLADLGEREIFGEMALIDGEPRSADAKALSDTTLGFLPRGKYNKIINERSELSYRLMSSICLRLLSHIRRLDNVYLKIKSLIKQKQ